MNVDDDGKENVNLKINTVNGKGAAAKQTKGKKIKLDSVDCGMCSNSNSVPRVMMVLLILSLMISPT